MGAVLLFLSLPLKNGLVFAMLHRGPFCDAEVSVGQRMQRLCQAQGRRYVLPSVWLCGGRARGCGGHRGSASSVAASRPFITVLAEDVL